MEEFKKELKELLIKHEAIIAVRQEDDGNFLYLNVETDKTYIALDSGYRDLEITPNNLK